MTVLDYFEGSGAGFGIIIIVLCCLPLGLPLQLFTYLLFYQRKHRKGTLWYLMPSLSHVPSVSLFVAWIIATLRKRDFKKLQKKKKASVRREVTGEAIHGEVPFSIL